MSENVQILMDKDELQPLANKIKILKGNNNSITLYGMENAIANANNEIESQSILLDQAIAALAGKSAGGGGAPVLQEKTITPTTSSQNVTPDSGYDGLSKVTVNAMPTATQATPTISVDSAGKITASATQSAGYVSAGTKTATQQLTTQAAKTITPSKSSQTAVASGRYTTGNITVAAIPSNYITTTDATATANDIVSSKTAYVNGAKITGTNPYEKSSTDTEVNTQATKLNELKSILQGKAAGGGGGSVETCTVTICNTESGVSNDEFASSEFFYQTREGVSSAMGLEDKSRTIQCVAPSYLICYGPSVVQPLDGNPNTIISRMGINVLLITGAATLNVGL